MEYMDVCEMWKKDPFFDEDTRRELEALKDPKEIEDRQKTLTQYALKIWSK